MKKKKGKKKQLPYIHVDILCPLTELAVYDPGTRKIREIARHLCIVRKCNGKMTLFAYCNYHRVKIFINDPHIVQEVLNGSTQSELPAPA